MSAVASGVSSIIAQARRAAQRRSQRTSTAHLLLVLLQSAHETAGLLCRHGVREGDLLSALKVVDDEPGSAFEVTVERAHKIALGLGEPTARPIHLLMSLVRDPRTAGYRCLDHVGAGAARVRRDVDALLGVGSPAEPSEPSDGSRAKKRSHGLGPTRAPSSEARRPRRNTGRPSARARSAELVREAHLRGETGEGAVEAPPSCEPAPPSPSAAPPAGDAPRKPDLGAFELDPRAFPRSCRSGATSRSSRRGGDRPGRRARRGDRAAARRARRGAGRTIRSWSGRRGVGKTAIVRGPRAHARVAGRRGVRGRRSKAHARRGVGGEPRVGHGRARRARGEDARLREEIEAESAGRVLLFLDEIHAVLGGSDGPDDIAHELKASLARGELPCIGATTDAEYRRVLRARRRARAALLDDRRARSRRRRRRSRSSTASRRATRITTASRTRRRRCARPWSSRFGTSPTAQLPDKAIGVMDLAARAGAPARCDDRRRGGAGCRGGHRGAGATCRSSGCSMRDAERLLRARGAPGRAHRRAARRRSRASRTRSRKGAAGFRGGGRSARSSCSVRPASARPRRRRRSPRSLFSAGAR